MRDVFLGVKVLSRALVPISGYTGGVGSRFLGHGEKKRVVKMLTFQYQFDVKIYTTQLVESKEILTSGGV